ncbi:MAG: hypothetical protein ACI9GM_001296 [Salibacteraceae bacterium]|jgi:hypothetical protein
MDFARLTISLFTTAQTTILFEENFTTDLVGETTHGSLNGV